jgi:superfamily II DNA or RNA helicase
LHLIQIGTLQTLINREISDVRIVIIDEAHFGSSGDMIASLYNKYNLSQTKVISFVY